MSFLYSHGYWIPAPLGDKLGKLIIGFTQCYAVCAHVCLRERLNRYPMMPKLHMIYHSGLRVVSEATRGRFVISPLATSVQQQEDYIGKPARLSRRVTATRLLHRRVMDRLLICTMFALKAADKDDRGLDVAWAGKTQGNYIIYSMYYCVLSWNVLFHALLHMLHLSLAPDWWRSWRRWNIMGSGDGGWHNIRMDMVVPIQSPKTAGSFFFLKGVFINQGRALTTNMIWIYFCIPPGSRLLFRYCLNTV